MIYEVTPCPVCGGAEATQVADREGLLAELELLWAFHDRRLRPTLPVARLMDRLVFSRAPALRLGRCVECGTILRSPGERAEVVERTYARERPDEEVLAGLFEAQRAACRAQARRLARVLGRTGSGLEVGSYTGAFLAAARDEGWRFEGVDVNPVACAFARERGLTMTCGPLQAVRAGRRFDAVAFWNCFDQLPDPRAAARSARDYLVPGGVLAVRVPNGACYLQLRRHLHDPLAPAARRVLALNNLLTFPYGHGFTPASLGRLLQDEGFDVVHVLGDVLAGTPPATLRPWAVLEERVARTLLRPLARLRPDAAPWIELYARRR